MQSEGLGGRLCQIQVERLLSSNFAVEEDKSLGCTLHTGGGRFVWLKRLGSCGFIL